MITRSLFVLLKSPAWYTVNSTSVQTQQGDDYTVFIRTTEISSLVYSELLFKHSRGWLHSLCSYYWNLQPGMLWTSPPWEHCCQFSTPTFVLDFVCTNLSQLQEQVMEWNSQKWLSNGRMTQLSQGKGPTGNSEVHYLTTTATTSNKAPSTDAKVSYLLCKSKLSFATLSGQHNPTSFSPLLVHSHSEEPVIADNCCCHQTLTKPSTKKKQLQMPPYSKSWLLRRPVTNWRGLLADWWSLLTDWGGYWLTDGAYWLRGLLIEWWR